MDIVFTKALSAALVMGFFLGVIFFLRFLYGPKGRFRDPQWDKWNEEGRRQEEEARVDKAQRESFLAYARSFFSGKPEEDALLQLKIDHTFKVLSHAQEIAASEWEFADPVAARALKVAALFHDIGRFEQVTRYHTFSDDKSCNHGVLGAKVLRRQGFLDREQPEVRRLALTAVAAHNRVRVPAAVSGTQRLVLIALRDADKLDILRVMAEHVRQGKDVDPAVLMHLTDEPASCSPEILAALAAGRTALYRDMRYINDFRLVLCSWLFDLHFAASFRIARREGHYEHILAGLSGVPEAQQEASAVVERMLSKA